MHGRAVQSNRRGLSLRVGRSIPPLAKVRERRQASLGGRDRRVQCLAPFALAKLPAHGADSLVPLLKGRLLKLDRLLQVPDGFVRLLEAALLRVSFPLQVILLVLDAILLLHESARLLLQLVADVLSLLLLRPHALDRLLQLRILLRQEVQLLSELLPHLLSLLHLHLSVGLES